MVKNLQGLKKSIAAFTLTFFSIYNSNAQLITDGTLTPTQLVQNVLLGSGVSVSNVTFTGALGSSTSALGKFSGTTNIGLSKGIVMTTGTIYAPDGPAGPDNASSNGTDNTNPGDALLNTIIGSQSTFNAAVLEFDFVPSSDTVKFRYVFGSEEYPEYVCSTFNDIFGFFISGPNPSGGNYTNKNIALVPGTNLPVAINTINPGVSGTNGTNTNCTSLAYSSYYTNNLNGTTIQYDGFTKVLTAVVAVNCGSTYHIKLAIADVGDGDYDSGVFLEAGSFSSKTIALSSKTTYSGNDTVLFEGCGQANIIISRGGKNLNNQDTMLIKIGGTAINGTDYTPQINDTLIFAIGVDSISIPMNAINDALAEGLETITVTVTPSSSNPCLKSVKDSITIYIKDRVLAFNAMPDKKLCPGQTTTLVATASGGVPPYNYTWNTGSTSQSITVSTGITKKYFVTIGDTCGTPPVTDTVLVTILTPTTLVANAGNDTTVTCPVNAFSIKATATGGIKPYNFSWSSGLGTNATATVQPKTTTVYTLTVTDSCGTQIKKDSIKVIVNSIPLIVTASNDVQTYCPGTQTTISATATGGSSGYIYSWDNGLGKGQTKTVSPSATIKYVVTVIDSCGGIQVATDTVMVTVPVYSPLVVNTSNDTIITCPATTPFSIKATATGGSGGYKYTWSNGLGNSSTVTINPQTTTTYTVTAKDSCGSVVATDTIKITVAPAPFTITSKNDTNVLCPGNAVNIWALANGPATNYTYVWSTGSVAPSLTVSPTSTKTYTVTITDNCGPSVKKDSVKITVPIYAPLNLSTPNPDKVCPGKSIDLQVVASGGAGGYVYSWTTVVGSDQVNSPNSSSISLTVTGPDKLVVLVKDLCGTVLQNPDTIKVDIETACELIIPNVISPNGDNLNDYFIIENLDQFPNSTLIIYNRWGLKVLEDENYLNNWNADNKSDGTYYYILYVSDKRKAITGFLTVVRN